MLGLYLFMLLCLLCRLYDASLGEDCPRVLVSVLHRLSHLFFLRFFLLLVPGEDGEKAGEGELSLLDVLVDLQLLFLAVLRLFEEVDLFLPVLLPLLRLQLLHLEEIKLLLLL
jgi:hypothetical protein